jgi:hypothetical protein
MRRAWVTVAALVGALCVPGSALAVDHVSLFVSPSAVAGHPAWRLSASVPAREVTGGEIVGVSLRRGLESHDLRGAARSTSSIAFDSRRGTWRVDVGSSLTVRMTIATSGPARRVGRSFKCRGGFMEAPVVLHGRFVVRTGTWLFGAIRRSRLAGTIVFNTGESLDCTPLPTVCAPSARLLASRSVGDSLSATSDGGGYLGVSLRQPVRGGAWYHRLELTGFDPLTVSGSSVDVRAPAGLPLTGSGTFTPTRAVGADSCGIATAEGTLNGSFRARFTGWPSRTLVFGPRDFARFASSGARPSG